VRNVPQNFDSKAEGQNRAEYVSTLVCFLFPALLLSFLYLCLYILVVVFIMTLSFEAIIKIMIMINKKMEYVMNKKIVLNFNECVWEYDWCKGIPKATASVPKKKSKISAMVKSVRSKVSDLFKEKPVDIDMTTGWYPTDINFEDPEDWEDFEF